MRPVRARVTTTRAPKARKVIGPSVSSGYGLKKEMSTEGAAQFQIRNFNNSLFCNSIRCRAFSAQFYRSIYPGLTAGPIIFRAFGARPYGPPPLG